MARRRAKTDSQTRRRLLDAAEHLMAEEGYAAVTSRRVGATAGITSQLVHYYFETMDELFVEVLRRRADAGLDQLQQALNSGTTTLRRLWELRSSHRDAVIDIEFVALANHRKSIRDAIGRYAARHRALELALTERAMASAAISPQDYPPSVVLQALVGMSQIMVIEASLGIAAGHDDTQRFVQALLDRLERHRDRPGPRPANSETPSPTR
jgi:AcrR family transcriptional regulator